VPALLITEKTQVKLQCMRVIADQFEIMFGDGQIERYDIHDLFSISIFSYMDNF